jgi:hypothetical protein
MACSHSEDCDGRSAECPVMAAYPGGADLKASSEWVRVRVMTSVRIDLENRRLRRALETAAIRFDICAGRMRACHEETGNHELLAEVEMFAEEAREALRPTP